MYFIIKPGLEFFIFIIVHLYFKLLTKYKLVTKSI